MKRCKECKWEWPDHLEECPVDGCREFIDASVVQAPGSPKPLPSCCPNPECTILVVAARGKFCAECGSRLTPMTLAVWDEKLVRPALVKDFISALLNPSPLFLAASKMGFMQDEAEDSLNKSFANFTNVSRTELYKWVQEDVLPLSREENDTTDARQHAMRRAESLGIFSACAETVIQRLAPATTVPEPQTKPPISETPSAPATPIPQIADSFDGLSASPGRGEIQQSAETILDLAEVEPTSILTQEQDVIELPRIAEYEIRQAAEPALPPENNDAEDKVMATEGRMESYPVKARSFSVAKLTIGIILAVGLIVIYLLLPSFRKQSEATANNQIKPETTEVSRDNGNVRATSASAPQSPANVNANLDDKVEIESGEPGVLLIYTNVDGVTLVVDNGAQVTTLSRRQAKELSLLPGQHFLRASKPGYQAWAQPLRMEPGARLTLQVPLMASEQEGTAQAQSSPLPQPSVRAIQNQADAQPPPVNYPTPNTQSPSEQPRTNNNRPVAAPSVEQASTQIGQPARNPSESQSVTSGPSRNPKPRSKVQADWPESAYKERISGSVYVAVTVDRYGNVTSARAIKGPEQLRQAAVRAALQCKFDPALQNGQPVEGQVTVVYTFSMFDFR